VMPAGVEELDEVGGGGADRSIRLRLTVTDEARGGWRPLFERDRGDRLPAGGFCCSNNAGTRRRGGGLRDEAVAPPEHVVAGKMTVTRSCVPGAFGWMRAGPRGGCIINNGRSRRTGHGPRAIAYAATPSNAIHRATKSTRRSTDALRPSCAGSSTSGKRGRTGMGPRPGCGHDAGRRQHRAGEPVDDTAEAGRAVGTWSPCRWTAKRAGR